MKHFILEVSKKCFKTFATVMVYLNKMRVQYLPTVFSTSSRWMNFVPLLWSIYPEQGEQQLQHLSVHRIHCQILRDTLSDTGDTLSDTGDTLSDIGDKLPDIGDTLSDIGDILSDIRDTLSDIGETLSKIEDTLPNIVNTLA